MKFLRLKLQRYFEAAEARHQRMLLLLDDAWWEQMWGFNFLLKFNLSMVKHYVELVGSLIADLKSLSHAMQLEQYDQMHVTYMKALQRDIYVIQVRSGDLLNEISREIHASTESTLLQLQQQLRILRLTTFGIDRAASPLHSASRSSDGDDAASIPLGTGAHPSLAQRDPQGCRGKHPAQPVPVFVRVILSHSDRLPEGPQQARIWCS